MSGPVAAVLLDIEGTTTPVDFVYRVLFPYALARVADYLAEHGRQPEVEDDVAPSGERFSLVWARA